MTDEPPSSRWTPFYLWALAPVWILGMAAAAWRTGSVPLTIVWIGGSLALLWYTLPLRRIVLRGD